MAGALRPTPHSSGHPVSCSFPLQKCRIPPLEPCTATSPPSPWCPCWDCRSRRSLSLPSVPGEHISHRFLLEHSASSEPRDGAAARRAKPACSVPVSFTYASHVLAIICSLPHMRTHTCIHVCAHPQALRHAAQRQSIPWAEYPKQLAQSLAHSRCSINVCRFQQGCLFHNPSPVQTPSGPLGMASSGTLRGLSPSSTREPDDPPQSTSHPVSPTVTLL